MNTRDLTRLSTVCGLLGALCLNGRANADNLTTTNVQASGANWTAAIWKTNGAGTAVAPVAANTYQMIFNGITIGNGVASTRVRNPATAGVQTFPGASLTMDANTELRAKQSGAILNFPGVGGNPGLILNGGMLNGGDDATFALTGNIRVTAQSYISHGANGGGGGISANRAYNISGALSGSGDMVIINSGTTVPQIVSGNSNTYSGKWVVICGWLRGDGIDSLGTNSIIVDPADTRFLTVMPNAVSGSGPAWFEPNYDLNSAGSLTLANGGIMHLHQNCIFSSVSIEGTALTAGTHSLAELLNNFPASFAGSTSGSITVRPYSLQPLVVVQPQAEVVFANGSAHFNVGAIGAAPLGYQWRKDGTPLTDGGNISGANTANLVLKNITSADAGGYDVVVSNGGGSSTSSSATLTLLTPSETYETAVANLQPTAFYQLNETTDPVNNGAIALDNGGGFNGSYGNGVANGAPAYNTAGPTPADGFPGFSAANKAASFANGIGTSRITVPQWGLKTNTVTIGAWVKPSGLQNNAWTVAFVRGATTVAGLQYLGLQDANNNPVIGYTWNNEPETYTWNSGVGTPVGQWSFVVLVVTPTNATIQVMNTNGLTSATHTYAHTVQSFNGTTLIGDDSNDGGNGGRVFAGAIDDLMVFNRALSPSEVSGLYTAAAGAVTYAPMITGQPVASQSLYPGQNATFSVAAGGTDPLTYQWKKGATGSGVYTDITDGGRISGATTPTLKITGVIDTDAADYIVTVANGIGSTNSAIGNLIVQGTSPAENITIAVQQPATEDWDLTTSWSDGLPATQSAAAKPGSTYEVLAGARLRSPQNITVATFPGNVLKLSGNAIWTNNPAAGAPSGEIRLKQPVLSTGNGVVIFKKLIMNGGQLDTGNAGTVEVAGEINIVTNAPFYNDGADDRGYKITAQLTGTGNIEYHGYNQTVFQPAFTNGLNIAGTSNTYSGTWNVALGRLLGSGANSLGTNNITVGAQGALETLYDVNNPNSSLFLSGKMYLHQNDTFKSVFVNGTPLNPGTYTFAQLNTLYPNNFPATWSPETGSSFNTGSGSITVLVTPAPTITLQPQSVSLYPGQTASFLVDAQGTPPLGFRWRKGTTFLSDAGNISGSQTTNLVLSNVTAADAGNYTAVVTNAIGSSTSQVATLTILPTGPALNLTLDFGGAPIVQVAGLDWDTTNNWSDGNPASISAFSNPGSTYEVPAGARLRSPVGSTSAVFPGNVLTLDGDGVFQENGTSIAEIRFKHADPSTIYFKKLVLNGGQLDSGDNGLVTILGEIDVLANTPIYVDSAAGTDRSYQLASYLTGTGNIEWHQFSNALGGPDLNISGTSNTFSGKWNVVQGTLLGSGPGSLGTNDITVATDGALETLYNINNPAGTLTLDGKMFLHQNDTFKSVIIGGVPLADGVYSFSQLNANYPANFPATWTAQLGSTVTAGSGSITVGASTPPVTLNSSFNGSTMTLSWSQGVLLEADQVTGPWTTNTTATSPFTVTPSAPQKFYRIQVQ